jgi:hypothetical protein
VEAWTSDATAWAGAGDGLGLLGGEARLEGRFLGLRLGGHAFPERLLVLRGLELLLQGSELEGFLVVGGLVVGQLLGEGLEFGAEFFGLVRRRTGRDEGAGFELGLAEGPVEPDPELPSDLEGSERGPVVAGEGVVRGIPGPSDLAEKLVDLVGENPVVAQPVEKIVLPFLRPFEDADVRSDHLGEDFAQLAELQQAGVRILREIPLGQHPETQQLLIVRLQMGEVAAEALGGFGEVWHEAAAC